MPEEYGKLEARAASDQGVDHLRDGALVTSIETAPPGATLVLGGTTGTVSGITGTGTTITITDNEPAPTTAPTPAAPLTLTAPVRPKMDSRSR